MANFVRQYPAVDGNWLYHDEEDGSRLFSDYVIRSAESDPWLECTPAEKEQWEKEHQTPEPEPEPEV